MPKWGLTEEQRVIRPWGLDESLLQPDKTITDPVHGDIYVTRIERLIIDSRAMQRLRRVRQLGTTQLVYPGATHSRFSHSLGAMRAAQDLLDAVLDQRHGPDPARDVFGEWAAGDDYELRVAESMVLARLGALLHDLCHVSFGHSIEDDLGILEAHDKNIERYNMLWARLPARVQAAMSPDLVAALRPLILSKEPTGDPLPEAASRYPFVGDIVGNTICADLLDYLPRDHYYTGLPAKLGHRFLAAFYVTRSDHAFYKMRMAIRITKGGRQRSDAVSELFKYLRYRYELSERALVHHAKLAADSMVGKALEMWNDAVWTDEAKRAVPSIASQLNGDIDEARAAVDQIDPSALERIDSITRGKLEQNLLRRGDDGLLEHLIDISEGNRQGDRRLAGVFALADGVLNRGLFKLIGRCESARSIAEKIYNDHGSPAARRRLERDAARYVGLDRSWQVLLWIPDPRMRLKAAEVLVDDGAIVTPLVMYDSVGMRRGQEIYESHRALWAITVFVDRRIKAEQRGVLLARISQKLGGIKWDNLREQPSIAQIAARMVGVTRGLTRVQEERLASEAQSFAARGGQDKFADLLDALHHIARPADDLPDA